MPCSEPEGERGAERVSGFIAAKKGCCRSAEGRRAGYERLVGALLLCSSSYLLAALELPRHLALLSSRFIRPLELYRPTPQGSKTSLLTTQYSIQLFEIAQAASQSRRQRVERVAKRRDEVDDFTRRGRSSRLRRHPVAFSNRVAGWRWRRAGERDVVELMVELNTAGAARARKTEGEGSYIVWVA
jgi:hypothetical protein